MIIYTIELEGDFITFVGEVGTQKEGIKWSHRKVTVKEVVTDTTDDNLTLISIDNDTISYSYTEIENPSTVGIAFVNLDTFRTYMITNLTI